MRNLTAHRKLFHATRQLPHHPVEFALEATHATLPALDVLTERAESAELCAAPGPPLRAAIHFLRVCRALEVLIQRGEGLVPAVAEVALIVRPVPRALRSPGRGDRRTGRSRRAGDEARGVRDDVRTVDLRDDAVDGVARHTGYACTGLEVKNERGGGDERPLAALHGALNGPPLVNS